MFRLSSPLRPAQTVSRVRPRPMLAVGILAALSACNDKPDEAPSITLDATYEVEVTTEVYGQGLSHDGWGGEVVDTIDLELDVWEPVGASGKRPAVVLIHGGGFTGGKRSSRDAFAQFYAERGVVVANIDYRVAGDFGSVPQAWADYVEDTVPSWQVDQGMAMYVAARDAKAATRWLHAHADELNIDPDHVTAIGGSAGSYLAVMLGVSDAPDFRDELTSDQDSTLETTHLEARSDVHTIIDHWGGISQLEILEAIDGRSRFDESDAPVSIVHGEDDPTVSFEEAEKLEEAYIQTGVPYAFHPVAEGGHGIWDVEIDGQSLEELSLDFVVEQQGLRVE